jgi:hypothetical protein
MIWKLFSQVKLYPFANGLVLPGRTLVIHHTIEFFIVQTHVRIPEQIPAFAFRAVTFAVVQKGAKDVIGRWQL